MGREIRMVPPHWKHPKDGAGEYIPYYDIDYETASKNWKNEFLKFEANPNDERREYCNEYWEYESTPDESTCRPAFSESPTWFQVYETVSEGTPVSPAFATKEELIDYLAKHGDFWCQKRPEETPPTREQAKSFVNSGHAPSFVVKRSDHGLDIKNGISSVKWRF